MCPGCKISGGVSNIAFGFRGNDAVRRGFHSAFLHHACKVHFVTTLACGCGTPRVQYRLSYVAEVLASCLHGSR